MTDTPTTTEPIAKPWYLSKTMISLVAGIVMAIAPKVTRWLGIDIGITEAQANDFALFLIPQAVALYGRFTATHEVTFTAAASKELNDRAAAKS